MPICPRPRRILLFLLGAVVGLVGCTRPAPPADGRLAVVTSISPLGDLIRRVGGDRVTVTDLVPRGADPHEFEPRPADVTAVARARLFFANGLGLEGYLDKLVKNAGSKELRLVVLSREAGAFSAGGLRYEPEQATNPHLWLAVAGASAYVRAIESALSAADPATAAQYRSRSEAYLAELADLDRWIAGQIATIPADRREMVVLHNAWELFCEQYGLRSLSLVGNAAAEPSAQEYARMVDLIRREQVRAVFSEAGFNPKLMQRLAADTGVRFVEDLHDDTLGPGNLDSYIGMMRDNVRKIVEALS